MDFKRGIVINFDEIHDGLREAITGSPLNVVGLTNFAEDGRMDRKIDEMITYMESPKGRAFAGKLEQAGIGLEYEIHAMSWLLPRTLFETRPDLFRLDETGRRCPDSNCCPSSREALAVIGQNAVRLAQKLRPTTHRYFLWQDDNQPWCRCELCREWSTSDQNLHLMNHILDALRTVDPHATLAFLAYMNTLKVVPEKVKPRDGIFLEITGPIIHHLDNESSQRPQHNPVFQRALQDQLAYFGSKGAHVLEYWMDASLFSRWKKPSVPLPFDGTAVKEDAAFYVAQGFRSLTCFGVFLDEEYFRNYGEPPIEEYGRLLNTVLTGAKDPM